MRSLYVVGSPAAGKTTLVRALLNMASNGELPPGGYILPKPKWTITPSVLAVGHYMGQIFDGGDTVGYTQVMATLAVWDELLGAAKQDVLTIFDGDRFSYAGALEEVRRRGPVKCLHLEVSGEVTMERARLRGSNQNQTWIKGRVTKARRFFDLFPEHDRLSIRVDKKTPGQVVKAAKTFLEMT